jgi:DNA-directed RNA polymerase specialized sigma24 family protein
MQYLTRGFCSSERRQADARITRVLSFEKAFELLPPEDQALILAAHRDGWSAVDLSASAALPERSTRHKLRLARINLANILDRRHLL